jgi:hypothetical protein
VAGDHWLGIARWVWCTLWAVAVVGYVASLAALRWLSDSACPVPGSDSETGTAEWSWWPIGVECTFQDHVSGPGLFATGCLFVLIVTGIALVVASRARRTADYRISTTSARPK